MKSIDIYQHIKQQREAMGFTQKDLAEALSVSSVYISYIENGTRIPSLKLLTKLHGLKEESVPTSVKKLIERAKKPQKAISESINTVYQLKASGIYQIQTLQSLLKEFPDNLMYTLGLFHLLREKGEIETADQIILNAIPKMKLAEDRKWLEAYHFQLESTPKGFERAFEIMREALDVFEKKHPGPLSLQSIIEKKAELLFRLSLIYFDYGVFLFNTAPSLNRKELVTAKQQFETALDWHQQLRAIYLYPYSQMDYANIYFWLGLIELYSEKSAKKQKGASPIVIYWEQFISESLAAARYDVKQICLTDQSKPFFSTELRIINASFIALAHARLAILKDDKTASKSHLDEGEWFLTRWIPLSTVEPGVCYRFYYNFAHFYSLKAQYLVSGKDHDAALKLCHYAIGQAKEFDSNRLKQDLQLPLELTYFQIGTQA